MARFIIKRLLLGVLTLFATSNVVVGVMWGLFFYDRFTAA